MQRRIRHPTLFSPPGYLDEGLFGRVFLWILEILPYLEKKGVYPNWHVPSALYGVGPDKLVIPGAIDLAYPIGDEDPQRLSLVKLRDLHCRHIGPDWAEANRLWSAYFCIPPRVIARASSVPVEHDTLGLHYRGTDKGSSAWDSNPISHDEFLSFVTDFLSRNTNLTRVFLATDEVAFYHKLREKTDVEIIFGGEGAHHKLLNDKTHSDHDVTDHALLDCLLLSRCGAVLQTSSALSSFAKILNPDLTIYRCAASRAMWYGPYFPVAYIPEYPHPVGDLSRTLDRTMTGDWLRSAESIPYRKVFRTRINWAWRFATLKIRVRQQLRRLLKGKPVTPHDYFG